MVMQRAGLASRILSSTADSSGALRCVRAFLMAEWRCDLARALSKAGDRVRFAGYLSPAQIASAWADFDVAVHVPLSENCGGVLEPLLAGIPTIAGRIGGLPELVIEGVTGKTVPTRNPMMLARAIEEVLSDLPRYRELARTGRRLVRTMFDVSRTGSEVRSIYNHLLDPANERPGEFQPADLANRLAEESPSIA